jgi:hypothetical protein
MQCARTGRQPTARFLFENHLVKAIAARDTQDFGEAKKSHEERYGLVGKNDEFTQKLAPSLRHSPDGASRIV